MTSLQMRSLSNSGHESMAGVCKRPLSRRCSLISDDLLRPTFSVATRTGISRDFGTQSVSKGAFIVSQAVVIAAISGGWP